MILLIDNYDSFTWNLVQRLGEIDPSLEPGRDLVVVRADKLAPQDADALDHGRGPTHLIISPGPCTPKEAGNSPAMIAHFAGRIPILGVCLGHQCMADLNGMDVVRHTIQMHGKTSPISHDGRGVFAGLPNPFIATRYHSLVVRPESIAPNGDWEVSAWCEDTLPDGRHERVVMGLRRVWQDAGKAPVEGVQFHPESFLTLDGPQLLTNFLNMGR
ncbi:MAG: aminodeoxychorismate/anthranilate synthase component II [Phycisphaeraceae bacterium]|nr:aminodeoxychorismate/anthranilate synthase component II [Phycisphaeraceae bacterium]